MNELPLDPSIATSLLFDRGSPDGDPTTDKFSDLWKEKLDMAHSLAQIYVHIVFSTKSREPYLVCKKLLCQTHAYLARLCRSFASPALTVGGVADHVHILCSLSRTLAVAELVKELKRESSNGLSARILI